MKLVVMTALADDMDAVHAMLRTHGVTAFSELPVEGHGAGTPGWLGETPAYRSSMVLSFLPADAARELADAVETCGQCKDPRHPVRAWVVDVERAVVSRPEDPNRTEEAP